MSTRSTSSRSKRGFTLVELTMVVAILTVVAMLAVSKVGDMVGDAREQAVHHDLVTIRDAFQRLVIDCDGATFFCKASPIANARYEEALDLRLHNLFCPTNFLGDSHVTDELLRSAYGFGLFANRTVWKGPYLQPSLVHEDPLTHERQLLDPWGKPYVLQMPSCTNGTFVAELSHEFPSGFRHAWEQRRWKYARIVSSGRDGVLTTPNDRLAGIVYDYGELTTNRGDDVVLFINREDVWEDRDAF